MKTYLTTLSALFSILSGSAQDQKLPTAFALAELDSMALAIKAYHPTPFRYCSEEDWDHGRRQIHEMLSKSDSVDAFKFWRLTRQLVSMLRDEHLELNLDESEWIKLRNSHRFFPFQVSITYDELLKIEHATDKDLSTWEGKEIKSINGIASTEIIEVLKTCGGSSSTSDFGGTLYHVFGFDNFSRLYYLCVDQRDTYELVFSDGEQVSVNGFSDSVEKKEGDVYRFIDELPPILRYSADSSSAYLRISSFYPGAFGETLKKAKKTMDHYFRELISNQVKELTVDLRGNRGGTPFYSTYIAGYFFEQPFEPFDQIMASKQAVEEFPKKFKGPRQPTFPEGKDYVTLDKNRERFIVNHEPGLRYDGAVEVLTNGGTGSASGIFCGLLAKYKDVQFLGAETMGDATRMSGGQFANIEFPHSKTVLTIPLLIFVYGSAEPAWGTKPAGPIDERELTDKYEIN